MADARIQVTGGGATREFALSGGETILGRTAASDIPLDCPLVSRRHARIFRDPFGRLVLEDLGSHNGVYVNGRQITAHRLTPEDRVEIGTFALRLVEAAPRPAADEPDSSIVGTIQEDLTQAAPSVRDTSVPEELTLDHLGMLNRMSDEMLGLTGSSDLYATLCRHLSAAGQTIAAVLRLNADANLPPLDKVLAHQFAAAQRHPGERSVANLHLSRRVLEAVRRDRQPVWAGNTPTSEASLMLTVMDEQEPRTVFCAPIGGDGAGLDVVYLDLTASAARRVTLDLVCAAARQANFARRWLEAAQTLAERRVLDRQLELAREIQARLTPPARPQVHPLDVAVLYRPALWVGGDYCDLWAIEGGRVAFAVGDVCGKGLPAAMVMTNLHALLRTTLSFCSDLGKAADLVNRHMQQYFADEIFVTMILGTITPADGQVSYVNAGHLLPLLVRPGSPIQALGRPENPPLRIAEGDFKVDHHRLEPGCGLLILSDGITDARSPTGADLGEAAILACLNSIAPGGSEAYVRSVERLVDDFRQDAPQFDDMTLLAMFQPKA